MMVFSYQPRWNRRARTRLARDYTDGAAMLQLAARLDQGLELKLTAVNGLRIA
jgi:hypothetical protein